MHVKRRLTLSEAGLVNNSRLLAGGREVRMRKGTHGKLDWQGPFTAHVEGLPITVTYDGRGNAVVDRCTFGQHCMYYRRDKRFRRGGLGTRRAGVGGKKRGSQFVDLDNW